MTYAPVSPAALEKAINRMAADLRVPRDALLEALTPVVLEWCITRTATESRVHVPRGQGPDRPAHQPDGMTGLPRIAVPPSRSCSLRSPSQSPMHRPSRGGRPEESKRHRGIQGPDAHRRRPGVDLGRGTERGGSTRPPVPGCPPEGCPRGSLTSGSAEGAERPISSPALVSSSRGNPAAAFALFCDCSKDRARAEYYSIESLETQNQLPRKAH